MKNADMETRKGVRVEVRKRKSGVLHDYLFI